MNGQEFMKLQELGEAAKQLMDNPAFKEAFDNLNQIYWEQLVETPPEAKEAREFIHAKARYAKEFLATINLIYNNSLVARQQNAEQSI